MKITRGTIFKNNHQALYETYLIYLYSFGSNSYCIKVMRGNFGKTALEWDCRMYKHNLMTDRDMYPIVGHIDLDSLIIDLILKKIDIQSSQGHLVDGEPQ